MPDNIKILQNLDRLQAIVTEKGVPTDYFIRFIQNRGGALTDLDALITDLLADLATLGVQVDFLNDVEIVAGDALDGGGILGVDPVITIDHSISGVTPGTYGDATNSAQITVDEFGHVTDVTDVPISGGGGGGGPAWWVASAPTVASLTLVSGDATNLVIADDPDVGLTWDAGAAVGGNIYRGAEKVIATPSVDWTYSIRLDAITASDNYGGAGMYIRDTVGGQLILFGYNQSGLGAEALNNLSSYNTGIGNYSAGYSLGMKPRWLRLKYISGTNSIEFWVSPEGKSWSFLQSVSRSSYLSNQANRIGFGALYNRTGAPRFVGSIGYMSFV